MKCFWLRFAISNRVLIYRTIVSFVEDRDQRAMSSLLRIRVGKGDLRQRWRYDRSKRGAVSRASAFWSRPIAPGTRPWCPERLPVAWDRLIDHGDQSQLRVASAGTNISFINNPLTAVPLTAVGTSRWNVIDGHYRLSLSLNADLYY